MASSKAQRGEPAGRLSRLPVPPRGPVAKGTPVIPVVMIAAGMYLAWFGVHYWRSDVKYPTDPIKAVLQGKGLPSTAGTPTADETAVLSKIPTGTAGQQQALNQAITNPSGHLTPAAGTAQNVNYGKLLAAAYGWGPGSKDWPYLYSGWQEESGWSTTAANDPSDPYNHAYGIPQANPGTKMASFGSDWKTNPQTQIRWGLAYIRATYNAPSHVPGWTPNGPAAGYVGY